MTTYGPAATGDLDDLFRRLDEYERRLRELEMPTGSQVAQTLNLLSRIDDNAERDSDDDFSITTSFVARAEEVYTAPDYATRATVTVLGMASGRNQTGIADTLQARVEAETSLSGTGNSITALQTVPDGYFASVAPVYSFDTSLDPLETITFRLLMATVSGTWTADSGNRAQVSYVVNSRPIIP